MHYDPSRFRDRRDRFRVVPAVTTTTRRPKRGESVSPMRGRVVLLLSLGVSFTHIGVLWADWVVMKRGHAVEVASVEVTARAVHVVTLNGKRWSMIRDVVDVPATLAANRRVPAPAIAADSVTAPERSSPATPSPPSRVRDIQLPEAPVSAPSRVPSSPPSVRPRAALFVNGVITTSPPLEFAETRRFELFQEQAFINAEYNDAQAEGIEIGGVFMIKGPLGVGGSVELFRNDRDAAFEALLPHPFFFEQFREISGSRSDLSHEETAVHLNAVFSTHWGDAFFLDISGGPSLFLTRTEVLLDVLYAEDFPFDAVIPLGAESTVFESQPLGFNLGASATYRVVGPIGVDFGVRFSRGRVRVSPADGRVIEFDAGGVRAAAGVRFLFR